MEESSMNVVVGGQLKDGLSFNKGFSITSALLGAAANHALGALLALALVVDRLELDLERIEKEKEKERERKRKKEKEREREGGRETEGVSGTVTGGSWMRE